MCRRIVQDFEERLIDHHCHWGEGEKTKTRPEKSLVVPEREEKGREEKKNTQSSTQGRQIRLCLIFHIIMTLSLHIEYLFDRGPSCCTFSFDFSSNKWHFVMINKHYQETPNGYRSFNLSSILSNSQGRSAAEAM